MGTSMYFKKNEPKKGTPLSDNLKFIFRNKYNYPVEVTLYKESIPVLEGMLMVLNDKNDIKSIKSIIEQIESSTNDFGVKIYEE